MFTDYRISEGSFYRTQATAARQRPTPPADAESHHESEKASHPKSPPAHKRPSTPATGRHDVGSPSSAATTGKTAPQPAPDALASCDGALRKLPGVVGVTRDDSGITIETKSRLNSKFLDALLEDAIGGTPVHFKEHAPAKKAPGGATKPKTRKKTGPGKPQPKVKPRPRLSAAEKVVKQFGKALSGLPHVVGVEAARSRSAAEKTGDRGSAPTEAIVVKVDSAESVPWLDDMIEDTINGVFVQFEPSSSILPHRA